MTITRQSSTSWKVILLSFLLYLLFLLQVGVNLVDKGVAHRLSGAPPCSSQEELW